jgi:hypothetical protein
MNRLRKISSRQEGEAWHNSRSEERYRFERALIMWLKMRREKKVRSAMARR